MYRNADSPALDVPLSALRGIFAGCDDLFEMPLDALEDGLELLSIERAKDRAIRHLMMILDREEDNSIAERAAIFLERNLAFDGVELHVRDRLFAAPLPDNADRARMDQLTVRKQLSQRLWRAVVDSQEEIARTATAFAQAVLRSGIQEPERLRARFIEAGAFRALVERGASSTAIWSRLRRDLSGAENLDRLLKECTPPIAAAREIRIGSGGSRR